MHNFWFGWFEEEVTILTYLKYLFKRKGFRIGFCSDISIEKSFLSPYFDDYNKLIASIRLRVNDVIYHSLNNKGLNLRFFSPFSKHDAIVFQKTFSPKAYSIGLKSKNKGSIILLDLNVNYFETQTKIITNKQRDDINKFIRITDTINLNSCNP